MGLVSLGNTKSVKVVLDSDGVLGVIFFKVLRDLFDQQPGLAVFTGAYFGQGV